jgi:hypothetical protein
MLNAWERAYPLGSARRALEILCAASPSEPPEKLAALSVGTRDARLLTLREWFFGSRVASRVDCPRCGEKIESTFHIADVRVAGPEPAGPYALAGEGGSLVFRLPDSTDLYAIERCQDSGDARAVLLRRCLLEGPPNPSERIEAAIVRRMAELDPQANVRLSMECAACRHRWSSMFDIAAFFWEEIHAWAARILREVHTLAAAYGWSEQAILCMTPVRRSIYLEMVGQ